MAALSPRGLSFGRTVNLFAVVGIIIFLITAGLAASVFIYRNFLISDIKRMDTELAAAKKSFEPEFVDEAARLGNRIESIKSILASHRALSPVFDILEKKTLESVRFADFTFDAKGKEALLSMSGQAKSFNAVALQSDVFGGERYFKNPVFSNFSLNDKGDVTFNFQTMIDPQLLLYRESVLGGSATSTGSGAPSFE